MIRRSPVLASALAGAAFGAALGLVSLWYFNPFVAGDGADAAYLVVTLISLPTSVGLGLILELAGSSGFAEVAYFMLAPILNWGLLGTVLGLFIARSRRRDEGPGDRGLR